MRIALLARSFAHHSAYSGSIQGVRRQPGVEYLASWSPRWLPERVRDALVLRAGRQTYTSTSLGFELAAARQMLVRPRSLHHVLYGEDDYYFLATAAPWIRRLGGRLVVSFHQPPPIFDEWLPAAVAARILPKLDAAIVTTTEQAEHLARWMPAERIHRVLHGVDTAYFSPDGRRDPRPTTDAFTVITVGKWLRDFELLEQVVTRLAVRGAEVRFVVVSEPEVTERLGALPGVSAHSHIPDDQLRMLYREADALFLPLVHAAANNALLEGIACGLPVIATDLPAVREYVDASASHLVPGGDPAAAVEAIASLAAEPKARRAELGRRSRARAEQLDWAISAAALADVYREAMRLRR